MGVEKTKATRQELESKGWKIDVDGRMGLRGQYLFSAYSPKGLLDEYVTYIFDQSTETITEKRVSAGGIHV